MTNERRWLLPDTVQPAEGSGLPAAVTEVVPGGRYRFEVTGAVEDTPFSSHLCSGASLAITDDSGSVHYLNGSSGLNGFPGLLAATLAVKGWPPQEGDVWKDGQGQRWFVVRREPFNVLEMLSVTGDGMPAHCELALRMALVFRESAQP